jgi:hypothetical protein
MLRSEGATERPVLVIPFTCSGVTLLPSDKVGNR